MVWHGVALQAERESLLNEYVLMKYLKNVHLSTIMFFYFLLSSPRHPLLDVMEKFLDDDIFYFKNQSWDKRYHLLSIFFNIIKLIGSYLEQKAYYSYSHLVHESLVILPSLKRMEKGRI